MIPCFKFVLLILTQVLQFLELLYELRTLPNTIEYEDDRTVATMKLMAYLKQAERRFVLYLCNFKGCY